jgi:DNA replication protein DnaC
MGEEGCGMTEREVSRDMMIKLFTEARIRQDYWHVGWEDIVFDDLSTQRNLTAFYENIENCLKNGLGLFLTGDFGHGKSLIGSVILKRALKNQYSAFFISMFDFVDYYGAMGQDGQEFRRYVRKIDFLCIDDIGAESIKARDYSFSLLDNLLAERYKPTIFTSNKTIAELRKLYGEHLLEFIGTNKMKEILVDSGKSLRYKEKWSKLLKDDKEKELKW